jgi:thymidine kinase|tara:strand:- start:4835 stop:5425 length:591 start_codon:yes stop_codon:yes gene_type:complete
MFLENSARGNKQFGWIEVICGSMFSGKTEELIRRLKRAKIANQKIQIFKPSIDSRSDEYIESHDKNKIKSITVKTSYDVFEIGKDFDVIGIDEIQFFDNDIISVCNSLANNGVRVIAAGLDMDYLGNPFGPMPNLMAIAEYVTKVHAICSETGNIANYSYRKKKEDSIILIGEEGEYKALSRELFFKKMNSKKKKT